MLRALFLSLALSLAPVAYAADKPVSPPAFTQEFLKLLRAQAPGYTFTVKGAMEIQVKGADGKDYTIFLDNAYSAYAADPAAKDEVLQRYLGSFLETLKAEDAPVDRARIVPVIKDRPWLAEIERLRQGRGDAKPGTESVYEDYNEDLVILYAEDTPRNIRYLTTDTLREAGVTKAELRALAVQNLRALLPGIELRRGEHVSMITAGGDYEASLLLVEDIWTGGQLKVEGEVVVAIPARDLLLFTGSKNQEGLRQLRDIAAKAARESNYRLTERLYVYRGGRFQRFEP